MIMLPKPKKGAHRRKSQRKQPNRKPWTDKPYLDWVRSLPCCICSLLCEKQETSTQAAHWPPGNPRAPDCQTLPLCAKHHLDDKVGLDRIGLLKWEERFGTTVWYQIGMTFTRWWRQYEEDR